MKLSMKGTKNYLSGNMSSAIILSAASANFFWSTATGVAPEAELGLEFTLEGNEGLGEENSLLDAKFWDGKPVVLCFTVGYSFCFVSFSGMICSEGKDERKIRPASWEHHGSNYKRILWNFKSCNQDY